MLREVVCINDADFFGTRQAKRIAGKGGYVFFITQTFYDLGPYIFDPMFFTQSVFSGFEVNRCLLARVLGIPHFFMEITS